MIPERHLEPVGITVDMDSLFKSGRVKRGSAKGIMATLLMMKPLAEINTTDGVIGVGAGTSFKSGIQKMIDKKDMSLRNILYYDKIEKLKKTREIWHDFFKRDYYLDKWEEEYYVALFDYCLELATQAGFTFHLDNIDEAVAFRF